MMETEVGRSPDGSGSRASTEPVCAVSAVPASIPSAAPWWKCVQCGHREFREAELKNISAPMIRCCACEAIHSAPDPASPQALRWRIAELEARIAATAASPLELWKVARSIRRLLMTGLIYRSTGRDPKNDGLHFAEVPDWQLRDWLHTVDTAASAIEARRAETENTGSVHDSAGPKDDAQGISHEGS